MQTVFQKEASIIRLCRADVESSSVGHVNDGIVYDTPGSNAGQDSQCAP